MAKVLMVAEKPSIARSITQALAGKEYHMRKGWCQTCPIFEFASTFLKQDASIHVTSIRGHLYNLDFPAKYQSWQKDPLILYDAEPVSLEIKNEGYDQEEDNVIKHLQNEARNCTHLVLWLDCDLEGENICFEVISVVKNAEKALSDENIYRAHFSSLTEVDIIKAFGELIKPNLKASKAVDARREIDLKVGVSFTRFQTGFFHEKYGVLRTRVISFGPCQTPTLGFCVERSDEIANFKKETEYLVVLHFDTKPPLNAQFMFKTEAEANAFKQEVEKVQAEGALVTAVEDSIGEKSSPIGLNTVQMLKLASSHLKMSPYDAMHVAEQLYLSGLITYPRTETTAYASSFQLQPIVEILANNKKWETHCKALLKSGLKEPKDGYDAGDHPPITPCRAPAPGKYLKREELPLYELIVQHFLATVSPDVKYCTVTFRIAGHDFTLTGSMTPEVGFVNLRPWVSASNNQVLDFNVGNVVKIKHIEVKTKETVPPGYLTESDLLGKMEANRIGTAGSMPTHIQNVCDRNYVQVDTSSRMLIPTELGKMLVHGYKKIDPELVSPAIRGNIEKSMNRIVTGEATYETELRSALSVYKKTFTHFRKDIDKIDEFFKEAFTQISDTSITHLKRLQIRHISRKGGWKSCYNCGQDGHKIQDCPQPDSRTCFNCGQVGHVNADCTRERVKRTSPNQTCYSCGAEGHISRGCPNGRGRSRGSRGTARGVGRGVYRGDRRGGGQGRVGRGNCFTCNQPGHFAKDCPREGDESEKLVF